MVLAQYDADFKVLSHWKNKACLDCTATQRTMTTYLPASNKIALRGYQITIAQTSKVCAMFYNDNDQPVIS